MKVYKGNQYYTMSDVARATNVNVKTFWHRVNTSCVVDQPSRVLFKKRRYYTVEQYQQIVGTDAASGEAVAKEDE